MRVYPTEHLLKVMLCGVACFFLGLFSFFVVLPFLSDLEVDE
jgi:hypothetical protein